MAVRVLCFKKGITMATVFLINTGTSLIEELLPALNRLQDVAVHPVVLSGFGIEYELDFHQQNNVFLIPTPLFNELTEFNMGYTALLLEYLSNLAGWIQKMVRVLVQQKKPGTFIFFTTNPNVQSFLDYPISPILDESIHSLIKTLAKELHSLHFHFYGLCLEPLHCLVTDALQIRSYRKKMAAHSISKLPLKMDEVCTLVQAICNGQLPLVSGSVLPVGYGSVLSY